MMHKSRGFTLIELSIVLVIIGLIVGGVLVGQDLIAAATIRSQISQIEEYHTAVNTFRSKYAAIPGDLTAAKATQFGFVTRAGTAGRGDGNKLVQGMYYAGPTAGLPQTQTGEPAFFWRDLSAAGLIEGGFTTATDAAPGAAVTDPSTYIPKAAIAGNYVYVFSYAGLQYFEIARVNQINTNGSVNSAATDSFGLKVIQAYQMDAKIDNGSPISGNLTASYPWGGVVAASTNAAASSTSTCYETTTNNYSISTNGGNGINCAISIKVQW